MSTKNHTKEYMGGMGEHRVADLESVVPIRNVEGSYDDFNVWACMHQRCNYYEYRLVEGHREDK